MSCNHCNTKFNFFHKEMGCANCGLSFCSKCLKQKCKIPNKGTNEQNVCKLCYSKLASGTSSTNQQDSYAPPDTFLKLSYINPVPDTIYSALIRRLETLENPSSPPITVYKQDPKIQALRTGLSPADQKLLDRLEKLKEENGPPPTECELRKRLASLKGENSYVEGPSKPVYTVDTRTDQQKSDALLEQFINERDIELAHNPQEEIEARLASLRGQGVRPNEGPYISNLHDSSNSDDEEEIDKITKKIMDEVALEERCLVKPKLTPNSSNEDEEFNPCSTQSELPFCTICNNDARFRCLDCDGDLYCYECIPEVHEDLNETHHRIIPFRRK